MARQVAVRAGGAVARDRAHDDLRVELLEAVVAEAQLVEEPGPHGLDHDVGLAHEVLEHRDRLGLLEVEHQRLLAPVHVQVQQRRAVHQGPRHLPRVVAGGRLDLDDLGAEVDEVRRDGGGAEQRALDHPHAVEHGRLLAPCRSSLPSSCVRPRWRSLTRFVLALMPGHTTDCISVYAWRPKSPPSRPMPLILKPPNGVSMLRCAVLMPTLPERNRPARRKPRSVSLGHHVVVEAEVGAVGDGDGFLVVVEGQGDDHRPEDLLLDRLHLGLAPGEQRGGDVVAALHVSRATAVDHDVRALVATRGDVALDAVALRRRDDRADDRVLVERVADLHARRRRRRAGRPAPRTCCGARSRASVRCRSGRCGRPTRWRWR